MVWVLGSQTSDPGAVLIVGYRSLFVQLGTGVLVCRIESLGTETLAALAGIRAGKFRPRRFWGTHALVARVGVVVGWGSLRGLRLGIGQRACVFVCGDRRIRSTPLPRLR